MIGVALGNEIGQTVLRKPPRGEGRKGKLGGDLEEKTEN